MAKYNPLSYIPAPESIRKRLDDAELCARRLRILLRVAEEIRDAEKQPDESAVQEESSR